MKERWSGVKRVPYWALVVLLILFAAEVGSRVEDRLRDDIDLLANPNFEKDLFVSDGGYLHGRPNGRYKRWRLNSFGFRSHEMNEVAEPGVKRVMILGSSEVFGLYESPGQDFPTLLGKELKKKGDWEVINAALTGMTVRSAVNYWRCHASRFKPRYVIIYPSPLFYLNDMSAPPTTAMAPARPALNPKAIAGPPTMGFIMESRFLQRFKDIFRFPEWIQRVRDQRVIDRRTAGRSEDWLFRSVPQERLDWFRRDLETLIVTIASSGPKPILTTHAMRCSTPLTTEDEEWLWRARANTPRATAEVIALFQRASSQVIRELARKHHAPLVDAERALSGRPEYFADLIHFNDLGAAKMATMHEAALLEISHQTEQSEMSSNVPNTERSLPQTSH